MSRVLDHPVTSYNVLETCLTPARQSQFMQVTLFLGISFFPYKYVLLSPARIDQFCSYSFHSDISPCINLSARGWAERCLEKRKSEGGGGGRGGEGLVQLPCEMFFSRAPCPLRYETPPNRPYLP